MMYTKGLFVILLTVSAVVNISEACSCMPAHPQEHFCNADFVILARVKKEFHQDHTKIYKIKIKREFKMSEKAKVALKSGRLHTSLHESTCGVSLMLDNTYVIAGRISGLQPHFNLCGFTKRWSEVGHRQRKGFRLLFSKGCDCKIRRCSSTNCKSTQESCGWNYRALCQTDHGICLKSARGKCTWTRSLALKRCLYEGQKTELSPREEFPEPLRLTERPKDGRDREEIIERTEPGRIQRVGYYHYNKINTRNN